MRQRHSGILAAVLQIALTLPALSANQPIAQSADALNASASTDLHNPIRKEGGGSAPIVLSPEAKSGRKSDRKGEVSSLSLKDAVYTMTRSSSFLLHSGCDPYFRDGEVLVRATNPVQIRFDYGLVEIGRGDIVLIHGNENAVALFNISESNDRPLHLLTDDGRRSTINAGCSVVCASTRENLKVALACGTVKQQQSRAWTGKDGENYLQGQYSSTSLAQSSELFRELRKRSTKADLHIIQKIQKVDRSLIASEPHR